jgi:hypothetical protein
MRITSINKTAWLQIDKDKDAEDFFVELRDEDLSAKTKVYGYLSDSIIDLFSYMKDNWNKKPKSKKWASLEGEFELNFEMDKLGHITLVVSLCPNLFDGWKVTSNIFLEPNQLDEIYEGILETFKK